MGTSEVCHDPREVGVPGGLKSRVGAFASVVLRFPSKVLAPSGRLIKPLRPSTSGPGKPRAATRTAIGIRRRVQRSAVRRAMGSSMSLVHGTALRGGMLQFRAPSDARCDVAPQPVDLQLLA